MNRYCSKCQKEFDFPIKSMADLDNLVCPICHAPIDKNSRKPVDQTPTAKTEFTIGNAFAKFCHFLYIFYLVFSIVGVLGFIFKEYNLLYWMTGICLGAFTLQSLFRMTTFRYGFIFLPLGAAAGWFIFKSLQGICLGVLLVFIIRHLIRDLFFTILRKLINLGNSN